MMICSDLPSPPKLMQMHNMTDREAISCPISDQQPKGRLALQSGKVTPATARHPLSHH